jgi:hypothetical protein
MSRHRDFTVVSGPPEALSFTVGGVRASNGETWEEKFLCWPRIAPQAMADLALALRVTPEGERVWNAGAVLGFVRRALIDDDARTRWFTLCNDSDRAMSMQDDLGPLLLWLAEEFTGRPTEPPST